MLNETLVSDPTIEPLTSVTSCGPCWTDSRQDKVSVNCIVGHVLTSSATDNELHCEIMSTDQTCWRQPCTTTFWWQHCSHLAERVCAEDTCKIIVSNDNSHTRQTKQKPPTASPLLSAFHLTFPQCRGSKICHPNAQYKNATRCTECQTPTTCEAAANAVWHTVLLAESPMSLDQSGEVAVNLFHPCTAPARQPLPRFHFSSRP